VRNKTKTDYLQEENQTFEDFFRRTDVLAWVLGMNLSELPPILGISKAMLFAYRNGSRRITPKAWHKLKAAEQKAGIPAESATGKTPRKSTEKERLAALGSWMERDPDVIRNIRESRLRMAACRSKEFFDGVRLLANWSAKPDQIPDEATAVKLTSTSAELLRNEPKFREVLDWLYRQGMAIEAEDDPPPSLIYSYLTDLL
jgi:hypothetical protein